MKRNLILLTLALLFSQLSFGQNKEIPLEKEQITYGCAADHFHELNMAKDPAYKSNYKKQNEAIYKAVKAKMKARELQKNNPLAACDSNLDDDILSIPIVINIIHLSTEPNPGDGPSNPTDAQIMQGIQDLNDAFANVGVYAAHGHGANDVTNPDRALLESVNVGVEFCLAKRDFNGNPTTGIYRIESDLYSDLDTDTETTAMLSYVESQVGVGLFPDTDYSGVWLHSSIFSASSGFLRGRAIGTGILNLAAIWGTSQDNSKTQVHEFGHNLSLRHPFSGGCVNGDCLLDGDLVCDTPPDNSTTLINCNTTANTCSTDLDSGPFTVDQDDMHENYMDYSYQTCRNTFTQGQKDKMRAYLEVWQISLLNSKGCIPTGIAEAGIKDVIAPTPVVLMCGNAIDPIIEVENNGNTTISSVEISMEIDGGTAIVSTYSVSIPIGTSSQITLSTINPTVGAHTFFAEITKINGAAVDSYTRNNYYCKAFELLNYPAPINLDYCEDAEDGVINSDFLIYNPSLDRTFDIGNTTGCSSSNGNNTIRYESRDGETGVEDALYLSLDLTSVTNAKLQFDVSHKRSASNVETTLDVGISSDCGATFSSEYNKTSPDLDTAMPNTFDPSAIYVPDGCDDWRTETVDLSAYLGSIVILRFNVSLEFSWGQNLYLDNICFTTCPSFVPPPSTCEPTTANLNFIGIGNVTFNEINQDSGNPMEDNPSTGYADFATGCLSTTCCYPGIDYLLSVDLDGGSSSFMATRAWIDYNNNGVFENATELVMDVTGPSSAAPFTSNVIIPNNAVTDTYLRMRVFTNIQAFTDACADPIIGQAEDYAVLIKNLSIAPKVFLQGPLSGMTMADDLRAGMQIPTTEPYTGSGYTFIGGGGNEATTAGVLAVTGTKAVVDWVIVEIRDAPGTTVLSSRSALLLADGTVVDTDGVSAVKLAAILPSAMAGQNYQLAIRHRNHLGVMTAIPISLD